MISAFVKDPNAVSDYAVDWTLNTGGDSITASTWTPDSGITVNSSSFTTTKTVVWLSGGTLGVNYRVVNHITTAGGRQEDKTIIILCQDK